MRLTRSICLASLALALGAHNLRAQSFGVLPNLTPADLSSFAFLQPGAGVEAPRRSILVFPPASSPIPRSSISSATSRRTIRTEPRSLTFRSRACR